MRLVVPTDFEILEAMSNVQRQTAPNLAEILGRRRQYMNDRLSHLSSIGLIRKVGPSDRSGMYEITSKGLAALELRKYYDHENASDFAKLVDTEQPRYKDEEKEKEDTLLKKIQKMRPHQSLQEFIDNENINSDHIESVIEELESLGLIKKEEEEGERYYTITQVGEMVLNSLQKHKEENSIIDSKPSD